MQRNDALFDLIKTLSKSEKRFFKIYSSRHVIGEQNNYVKLFDFLDRQRSYDEKKLLEHFSQERFVNRLPVAKSYLFDLILKSMNTFHAGNSNIAKINDFLRQVEFLYNKGLYDLAQRQVLKAKRLAERYEKWSILPEIIRWEKLIWEGQRYSGKTLQQLEGLHHLEKDVELKLSNLNEYWKLQSTLYYQHNVKGIVRNREDLDKFADVFSSKLMSSEEQALTFEAKTQFYKVYATYFFIIRDFESCYNNIKKMVQLIESQPEKIEENRELYINSIHNLLNMSDVLKKHNEAAHYLEVLKKMMSESAGKLSDNVKIKLFEGYYYHLLKRCIEEEDFDEGMKHVGEVEEGLLSYTGKLNEVSTLMLCFYVFRLFLSAKNYHEADKWGQKILLEEYATARPDIYTFAKILNLLNSFELSKPYLSKVVCSTYRHLLSVGDDTRFNNAITVFISRLRNIASNNQLAIELATLRNHLAELQKDKFEQKAFAYFDFIKWLDERIPQLKHNKPELVKS